MDPQDTNAANYTPGGWPDPDYDLAIGHVTDVGAFASSPSPYGTFDQSGNVWEWNQDTIIFGGSAFRGMRGGTYSEIWDHLTGAYRGSSNPTGDYRGVGFRLASATALNANFTGPVRTDDVTPPTVASITTANANPTGALVVYYNVTFSENVTGVNATDFVLVASGDGRERVDFQRLWQWQYLHRGCRDDVERRPRHARAELGGQRFNYRQGGQSARGQGAGNGNSTGQAYTISRDSYNGPFLFYRESVRYDTTGNPQAQLPFSDDNAIATDKVAYLPGSGTANFANVSSYSKGINGLMIDIAGSHPSITADDFIFRVGNNNTPSSWATAPAPLSVSVRAGAGISGSDRVEIIWANQAIMNTWLEVITLANANTGLSPRPDYPAGQADVFFFGSAVGNSGLGDTATSAIVNAIDESGARLNPAILFTNIPITNVYDFNRDGQVNASDQSISRLNATNPLTVLKYLNIGSPPLAPQSDLSGGNGPVASALTSADQQPIAKGRIESPRVTVPRSVTGQSFTESWTTRALPDTPIARHLDLSSHWLTFIDEELLNLLATGQSHSPGRRR